MTTAKEALEAFNSADVLTGAGYSNMDDILGKDMADCIRTALEAQEIKNKPAYKLGFNDGLNAAQEQGAVDVEALKKKIKRQKVAYKELMALNARHRGQIAHFGHVYAELESLRRIVRDIPDDDLQKENEALRARNKRLKDENGHLRQPDAVGELLERVPPSQTLMFYKGSDGFYALVSPSGKLGNGKTPAEAIKAALEKVGG